MIDRVGWDALPAVLRDEVTARTGALLSDETVPHGLNCRLAATVRTQRYGGLFLKGVPDGDTDEAAALHLEALLGAAVEGVGPALRYDVRAAGWRVLVFDRVDGRHADLGPGSKDLDAVREVLGRMGRLRVPDGVRVPTLAERFAGHLRPGDSELLAGDTLLHTDTHPHNLLVEHATGRAYAVDWARPATGPAWVDAAYTAVRLMECDQPPDAALAWLATVPAWQEAAPDAVRAFVDAVCRHWTAVAGERNAEWSNGCYRQLVASVPTLPGRAGTA
ncbi:MULTISPECIES: phosphotransferase family protein [Streptomyces]|uniref:Aminoglycoside phosphotransferase n=1 Tax=Streptomyces tsukubensis (strain DSM 42081 / NBRC 108919 / NRRL 18488 / 9993) TaxID=1114943 RepID=I2MWB9_STRT9|nr:MULTISPECIES: phosphotransferase [Streptomyces]AZK93498.1 aminoglycoside phosphotransferase [Streptomyces tsukubensis]EIF89066.1 aminoglycoside phosphotransferase [Streptomyces tsukubensis NRRL18488]MYS67721.1 phosphotransferase [Streptomyces sp. SID5473]QKM70351.1 aminoglycoside phosphotransferase [Streptomyces tsukubensis NRRL18488]TAI45664.1 aminoglycoside phosphotransferase [Streptomyces tsukubensis]